jgi:hypothetical protein
MTNFDHESYLAELQTFTGTYFTENLFCQNFLNEKLVPGTYFI